MNVYEQFAQRALEILKTDEEARFTALSPAKAQSWRRSFYTMRKRLQERPPFESPYDKLEIRVKGAVVTITDQPILTEIPND